MEHRCFWGHGWNVGAMNSQASSMKATSGPTLGWALGIGSFPTLHKIMRHYYELSCIPKKRYFEENFFGNRIFGNAKRKPLGWAHPILRRETQTTGRTPR